LFNYQTYILCHYGTPGSESYMAYYDFSITTLTGTTVATSSTVTFSSTASISIGMLIAGPGIPLATYVSAIPSSTTITITNAATASAAVSCQFTGWRNYNGSYLVPDSTLGRIRSVEASGNFYFTSSTGIQKL